MQTQIYRMKVELHNLAKVAVVATVTAPSKFFIYIQEQADRREEMYEWRSRSNVTLAVEFKCAGRQSLREHI